MGECRQQKHTQHAPSTKTECDYLNGWIRKRSHTQKSHPKMLNPRGIAGERRRRRRRMACTKKKKRKKEKRRKRKNRKKERKEKYAHGLRFESIDDTQILSLAHFKIVKGCCICVCMCLCAFACVCHCSCQCACSPQLMLNIMPTCFCSLRIIVTTLYLLD